MSDDPRTREFSPALLVAITAALEAANRPLGASEVARAIGAERGDVNRVLYRQADRFEKVNNSRWRLSASPDPTHDFAGRPTTNDAGVVEQPSWWAGPATQGPRTDTTPPAPRRPGPFGPARELLPKDAHIEMVGLDCAVESAIDRMSDLDYSQLLIRGGDARAIGVFSWRQFSLRCLGLKRLNRKFSEVLRGPVQDFMRELRPADFIAPDQYIDTDVDWIKSDFVIVGSPEVPLGILTISDVWGILNDFAEAFVLLHEIELTLRSIVETVAGSLAKEWIARLWVPGGHEAATTLEGLTLHHFTALICKKEDRWPRFAHCIGGPRELFEAELLNVVDIRNKVMHFTKKASPAMCGHLKDFRDRLRTSLLRASR